MEDGGNLMFTLQIKGLPALRPPLNPSASAPNLIQKSLCKPLLETPKQGDPPGPQPGLHKFAAPEWGWGLQRASGGFDGEENQDFSSVTMAERAMGPE